MVELPTKSADCEEAGYGFHEMCTALQVSTSIVKDMVGTYYNGLLSSRSRRRRRRDVRR